MFVMALRMAFFVAAESFRRVTLALGHPAAIRLDCMYFESLTHPERPVSSTYSLIPTHTAYLFVPVPPDVPPPLLPPLCVTVFVTLFGYDVPLPAVTTIVPVRVLVLPFAATVNPHVPFPLPDAPVSVIHDALVVALHPVFAVTAKLLLPPPPATVATLPNVSVTARFPQSLELNADPAEFFASTQ